MIHGCVEQIPTNDILKCQEAVAAGTSTSRGSGWFGYYILALALLATPLLRAQEAQDRVAAATDEKPATPAYPRLLTLTHATSSATSTARNPEQPSHSIVLGEWRATPTYVDTGPFAAAEEHAYWTPTGRQFVVIRNHFEVLYNNGTPCSASRVRLQVDTGTEYELTDPDPPEATDRWPDEVRRSVWVFAVKPGEKPAALIVTPPPQDAGKCPNGGTSPWTRLGTDRVALALNGLPSLNDIAEVEEHSRPVRLGQLEITVTSVGLASGDWDGVRFLTPEHGHHEVVVSLATKNISRYPNCTTLYSSSTSLYDNRGFEYSRPDFGSKPMDTTSLVSGETAAGIVKFQIWDGTAPRLLRISRDVSLERDCAEKQHRPMDMQGGSTVRIPIAGVPAVSRTTQR
jgi:hypothetical protein